MNPPGRFLKESEGSKTWIEIPMERVLKKTKQALREPADTDEGTATISTDVAFQSPEYYPNLCSPSLPVGHYPLPIAPDQSDPEILCPSIITARKVYEQGTLLCSTQQQAPFAFNENYQVMANGESDPAANMLDQINFHQKHDTSNNRKALFANSRITGLLSEVTRMGDSSSSILSTASTAPVVNSRRQHFREMKNEASSLESFPSQTDNTTLNMDDIMKESLLSLSIEIQGPSSIEIQESVEMRSMEGASFGAAEIQQLVGV